MKTHLLRWTAKLADAKESAKAAGQIVGDIDLATIVSEKIKAAGLSPVDRGAVNHWLKGRRLPNVPQFLALCEALNVHPADILATGNDKIVQFRARDPGKNHYMTDEEADIYERLREAPMATRRLALAAAMAVLEKSGTASKPQRRKPQR